MGIDLLLIDKKLRGNNNLGSAVSKLLINMSNAVENGSTKVNDVVKKTGKSLRDLELISKNDTKAFKDLCSGLGMTTTEMNNVIKHGKNLQNFAKVAGMSVDDFSKKFREDAPGALQAFLNGLRESEKNGKTAIQVLDEMGITEVRLRDTILRLAGGTDTLGDALKVSNEAYEEGNALQKEASQRYGDTKSQIEILKNKVQRLAIEIGDRLLPVVIEIVDKIEGWVEAFKNLDPNIQDFIIKAGFVGTAVGIITTAMGGGLKAVGQITLGFGKLLKEMSKFDSAKSVFQAAVGGLLNPVGAMVLAVGLAAGALVYLWKTNDTFREKVTTAFNKIKETFKKVGETIDYLEDKFPNLFETIKKLPSETFSKALEGMAKAIESLCDIVGGACDIICAICDGDWSRAWEGIKGAVEGFLDFLTNVPNLTNPTQAIMQWLIEGISFENIGEILDILKEFIKEKIESITTIPDDTENPVGKILVWMGDAFEFGKEILGELWETIKTLFSDAIDWLGSIPEIKENPIYKLINWFIETFTENYDSWKENIDYFFDVISYTLDWIAELPSERENPVGKVIGWLKDNLSIESIAWKDAWDKFCTSAIDVLKNFVTRAIGLPIIKNIVDHLKRRIEEKKPEWLQKWNEFKDKICEVDWVGKAREAMNKLLSGLFEKMPNVSDFFKNLISGCINILQNAPFETSGIGCMCNFVRGICSGAKNVYDTIRNVIQNIKSMFENASWSSIGTNIANKISSAIGRISIPNPVAKLIGGFAIGTRSAPKGQFLVAERGPELIDTGKGFILAKKKQLFNFKGGEKVYTASETRKILNGTMESSVFNSLKGITGSIYRRPADNSSTTNNIINNYGGNNSDNKPIILNVVMTDGTVIAKAVYPSISNMLGKDAKK